MSLAAKVSPDRGPLEVPSMARLASMYALLLAAIGLRAADRTFLPAEQEKSADIGDD